MKQTLTAMLLIVLFSVFAFANEKSGERPTTFDNPLMVAGPSLEGTLGTLNESFEGTFPPAGWVKFSPDGGTGWEQITAGTTPLPGWGGGIAYPAPDPDAGSAMAFATWTTGGAVGNEQWLVSAQVTGIQTGDDLSFWMYKFSNLYSDTVYIKVSTTDSLMGSFTDLDTIGYAATDTGWAYYSYNLDAYDGQDIYIAFVEKVADNWNNGAAVMLDVVKVGAPMINVTFRANVAGVEGIDDTTGGVDIRGSLQGWTPLANPLMSDGGDYWSITWQFPMSDVGTTVEYKFGGSIMDPITGSVSDYWENDLPGANYSGGNRSLVVPAADTVLDLQWVGHNVTPPVAFSDSFDVYFRLNMSGNPQFNPANDVLSIVGDFPAPDGAANMWNPGAYQFTREGPTSDYWNYHLKLAQPSTAYASAGTVDSVYFRFAIGTDWSNTENIQGHGMFPGNENRGTVVRQDTTIAWKYWNDNPPALTGSDTVMVEFRTDMSNAILENGFAIGDTLFVKWGYNATAMFGEDTLVNEFLTNKYTKTVEVASIDLGSNLQYQYYILINGAEEREIFFDFTDPEVSSQEKRKIAIPLSPPATIVAQDTIDSDLDPHRMPRFRDTSPIGQNVTVTWTVDLRPAYYQVLEGDTIQNDQGSPPDGWIYPGQEDSIFVWGVWMNGPAVGGWSNPAGTDWGADLRANLDKKLYDDGTNGDMVVGDSIYSRQVLYSPDSSDIIGQIYKFGIYGGDNEAGDGGYGNNHVANIDDSGPTFTIHTEFGSINQYFYWVWFFGYDPTGIIEENGIVLRKPTLSANYPNPFNPVTTMSFELPEQMDASLVIFNVLGQKVKTLLNGPQNKGVHKVLWNGTDDKGRFLSSGVYFYQLKTANFERTMKMMLLK